MTREIYWNIVAAGLIYVFAVIAVGFLGWGLYRRLRLWRLGRPESRLDRPLERLRGLLVEVFGHRRLLRQPFAGVSHLFIFYGFLAQLAATSLIALQEWTGIHFLRGPFYLGFSLVSDTFGILAIVGLGMAIARRFGSRPPRPGSLLDDWVALGLLLLVFVQGFAVEGLRIAATELHEQPGLAPWSPGGYAVALTLQGLGNESLRGLHRVMWWFHAVTAFGLLGYMAFGKLNHVFFGTLNIFFRSLEPSGKLTFPDIEATLEENPDAMPMLGVDTIEKYSWKSLLDLDACMSCGRCEAVCPATLSGVPLSPRKLILDLRDHLTAVGSDASPKEDGPLFGSSTSGSAVPAVLEEELWGCRTCGACQQECPVHIEHIPKMIDMRRHLVMAESRMSDEARQLLRNLDDRGHPWVGGAQDREAWFRDLDLKVLGRGDRAETLFWVGCTGALMERNVRVTRAMAKVLKAGGVDFAVLGAEEACTGDPARRVGGELTFQTLAKQNIETFERYGVRKIVTTCPHCLNTLKNEYPDFGARTEVVHHTELIDELRAADRLRLRKQLDSVTYHDPCYLGRHNGVYEAPREILRGLAKSGGLTELGRNRSRSLCCGAGGGYAWMDDAPEKRINHIRVEEIRASGAETAAVSCPFCMHMVEEGLGAGPDGGPRAVDVAELVAEALEE
ncbi:MAG: heterodisulfide reductase-related iron-sulfur binding cluster [Myxococcota bacterium]